MAHQQTPIFIIRVAFKECTARQDWMLLTQDRMHRVFVIDLCTCACTQEAGKLADAVAASEEHVEELKARITARQDWITREQESVDTKIEEATRPVAAQRTHAAEQHSTLQEEVEELRCGTVM